VPEDQTEAPVQAPDDFWGQIGHQLHRIRTAKDFESLREVLLDPAYDRIVEYVHQNGAVRFGPDEAFFAGTGGKSIVPALCEAGWDLHDRGEFHWVAEHPATGSRFEYIEGDLRRLDH